MRRLLVVALSYLYVLWLLRSRRWRRDREGLLEIQRLLWVILHL